MATTQFAQWYVRTDGSLFNGAGWDSSIAASGTNYANQAAAQLTRTDATTSNVSTALTIPATGTPFDASMVGNSVAIVIAATYTCTRFITAFVSGTQVTLDSAPSTSSAGAATINVGGATKLTNAGFLPFSSGGGSAAVKGNKVWVQGPGAAADYTLTTNPFTIGITGTDDKPFTVEGFTTTPGDGGRPTVFTNAGGLDAVDVTGQFIILKNLDISMGAAATFAFHSTGILNLYENCVFHGIIPCREGGGSNTYRNCEIYGAQAGNGGLIVNNVGNSTFDGCAIHGNAGHGVTAGTAGQTYFENCLIYANGSDGVNIPAGELTGLFFRNCVFWNNGRDGIRNDSTNAQGALVRWFVNRCIFGKNVGYDLNFTLADATLFPGAIEWAATYLECNAFYTTGTGKMHNLPANSGDITLTVSPFTSDTDFTLNGTAGGGAALIAAPCTTTLPDGNTLVRPIGFSSAGAAASTTGLAGMRSLWREYTGELSTEIADDVVDIYLQAGLEAFNRRVHYHFTTAESAVTLVAGTQEYTLPTDCVVIEWVYLNGVRLQKRDIEDWDRREDSWRTEPQGTPMEYAHEGNRIIFRPAPNALAVAADSQPTIRYVSTPPSITTSGPEQLVTADYRTIVLYGAAQWSVAHPDAALAVQRAKGFMDMFNEEVSGTAEEYKNRSVAR